MEVVTAAREPLDETQLAAATAIEPRRRLPQLLRALRVNLPPRLVDGTARYVPWHKSLVDWLTDDRQRGATYWIDPRDGHTRLAHVCLKEYRRGPRGMSAYALAHLPEHLAGAECWPDLEVVLTDLAFLEAKNEAGAPFELAGDFSRAVAALPEHRPLRRILKLLEEALRRDIHFIARHAADYPQALFQCLWNSGWWYDCPDAAKHYVDPVRGWKQPPPWRREGEKLSTLLERWKQQKEAQSPGLPWLRSLRPAAVHLGTAQQAIFRGHEGGVNSVAFSPDGRRIASGGFDKTVRIWDAASGAELACLPAHERAINSVAFSPDGRRIASGGWDEALRVWNAASGAELACLRGHDGSVWSVAFSPDGRRIGSGGRDATVRVWDAASGAELACLRAHDDSVNGVAFSLDGRRIASGGHDRTVRIWDAASGAELACLRGHDGSVWSVAFSPDGRRVASGSDDKTVRVWDAASGAELSRLRAHEGSVFSVAFSPDGRQIISGSYDQTVRVWDTASGAELACLRGHGHFIQSVAYSPDGRRIASGSGDKTVPVWDATSGAELSCLRAHEGSVFSVAFSPDGCRIVSGSSDKTVRVWNAASGAELACLRGHDDEVYSVDFSPDGRQIASGSGAYFGEDKTVLVWDAASGDCLEVIEGAGDLAAIAGGPEMFLIRAMARGRETIVEASRGGQPVAFFVEQLHSLTTHPTGRAWAGGVGSYLCLIQLEGEVED